MDLIFIAKLSLEQLFHRCEWRGLDCKETTWVPVWTEVGLCYTFNGNSSTQLYATETG